MRRLQGPQLCGRALGEAGLVGDEAGFELHFAKAAQAGLGVGVQRLALSAHVGGGRQRVAAAHSSVQRQRVAEELHAALQRAADLCQRGQQRITRGRHHSRVGFALGTGTGYAVAIACKRPANACA